MSKPTNYVGTKRRLSKNFGAWVYEVIDQTGLTTGFPTDPEDAIVLLKFDGTPHDFQAPYLPMTVRAMLKETREFHAPVHGIPEKGTPVDLPVKE